MGKDTPKVVLSVRVPAELHERLSQMADAQQRTVNGQILFLVQQALANERRDLTAQSSVEIRDEQHP